MWDELDLWHSKLNELDSEVQDLVEQDPGQAQEWMDNLMVPFQQYQQVSQRAESRTSQLNKVTPAGPAQLVVVVRWVWNETIFRGSQFPELPPLGPEARVTPIVWVGITGIDFSDGRGRSKNLKSDHGRSSGEHWASWQVRVSQRSGEGAGERTSFGNKMPLPSLPWSSHGWWVVHVQEQGWSLFSEEPGYCPMRLRVGGPHLSATFRMEQKMGTRLVATITGNPFQGP